MQDGKDPENGPEAFPDMEGNESEMRQAAAPVAMSFDVEAGKKQRPKVPPKKKKQKPRRGSVFGAIAAVKGRDKLMARKKARDAKKHAGETPEEHAKRMKAKAHHNVKHRRQSLIPEKMKKAKKKKKKKKEYSYSYSYSDDEYWDPEMIVYEEYEESTSCCSMLISGIISIGSFILGLFCVYTAATHFEVGSSEDKSGMWRGPCGEQNKFSITYRDWVLYYGVAQCSMFLLQLGNWVWDCKKKRAAKKNAIPDKAVLKAQAKKKCCVKLLSLLLAIFMVSWLVVGGMIFFGKIDPPSGASLIPDQDAIAQKVAEDQLGSASESILGTDILVGAEEEEEPAEETPLDKVKDYFPGGFGEGEPEDFPSQNCYEVHKVGFLLLVYGVIFVIVSLILECCCGINMLRLGSVLTGTS